MLFFIYNKILKLETSIKSGAKSFSESTSQWEQLLQEKARKAIQNELLSHNKQLLRETISSSSLDSLAESEVNLDRSKDVGNDKSLVKNDYPKGPDIISSTLRKPTPKATEFLNDEDSATRIKRNIHHRRQYRDESGTNDDELSVQLQGQSSDEAADKSWLQLTSYARIPVRNYYFFSKWNFM